MIKKLLNTHTTQGSNIKKFFYKHRRESVEMTSQSSACVSSQSKPASCQMAKTHSHLIMPNL